jgi:DnaJ-class molecular chaperone
MKDITVSFALTELFNICTTCSGSGKLKAMQAQMTYDAGSVRGPDTTVKCPDCKGTGVIRK